MARPKLISTTNWMAALHPSSECKCLPIIEYSLLVRKATFIGYRVHCTCRYILFTDI